MVRKAQQVLQSEFHTARAKILELASFLDRLDRAEGSVDQENALALLQAGIDILKENGSGRAEKVQLLMSRPFDPQWREQLDLSQR